MSFRLLANVDIRIDLLRLIVELKSLKRYKNVFSFEFDILLGFNVKNDRDFRVVGAIFWDFYSKFHFVMNVKLHLVNAQNRKHTVAVGRLDNTFFQISSDTSVNTVKLAAVDMLLVNVNL